MKIIDARLRPPYKSIKNMSFYNEAHPFSNFIVPEIRYKTMEQLIKDMDDAGIMAGVVPVRESDGVLNEDLDAISKEYPGRFIGLAAIDPWKGSEYNFAQIDQYVNHGSCVGIVMELPFLRKGPLHADDKMIYPIYDKCQRDGIPVYLQWGGMMAPRLDLYNPLEIDHVAGDFPQLHLILAHGGWPFVTEICWICMNHPNVFIAPDRYMTPDIAGYEGYQIAAQRELRGQICFSTAYPLAPLKPGVDGFKAMNFDEALKENVFFNNIVRALKLNPETLQRERN